MNTQLIPASKPDITKIMIVDDDVDILDSLRDVLELESDSYDIQTVSNVEAAKDLSSNYHPDIALLDIKIGKDIGLDLVPELKQDAPYIKCIMMTAFRESEYAAEAVRKGADDYLFKPLEAENLLRLLNQYSNAVKLEKSNHISQKRFQTMFEQSFQNTYILSAAGKIIDINTTALKLSQNERTAILHQPLWETPPFSYHDKNRNKLKSLINELDTQGYIENGMRLLDGNNKELFLDFAAKPIISVDGYFDSIIVEITDNSEIYYANETINELNHGLEARVHERTLELKQSILLLEKENQQRKLAEAESQRASEAKSLFLSRVSHELRTPMNAILGFTQLLEMEALNEEQEDYLSEIHGASDHLMDLISEILDLSRIESGKLEVNIEDVSLCEILASCARLIEPLAEQRQIKIELSEARDSSHHLRADPKRLKQIILNLLSNAIKYNVHAGRVEVTVTPVGIDQLRVSVHDTGIGIDPDMHHRVFNPFDMLGQEYTQTGSSGIGLAITKKLVESMDGSISFESEKDMGSTFHVLLPLGCNSEDC